MAPEPNGTESLEDDDPLISVLHGDTSGSGAASGTEPLACVSCRARKLKCDRLKPTCTRCLKVDSQCIYPESRRKPTVKRRNVKELEARLAQVEDYLKEVTKTDGPDAEADPTPLQESSEQLTDFDFTAVSGAPSTTSPARAVPDFSADGSVPDLPNLNQPATDDADFFADGQLMDLGVSEGLPPMEVMEELNRIYFSTQHFYIPVVHPGRYLQAFYGGPLRKPPMCLQYAIWAMASYLNDKYGEYTEVFYLRARQYADADEMKGYGEHFITLFHAQAYCVLASFEAKSMLFTRAALTTAKCVRLVNMMGLDSLDGAKDDIPPTLAPPTSWADLEERRRTFWGAYTLDAHSSVATGWPSLIQCDDITTKLPVSEEAFLKGKEQDSVFLEDVYKGDSYGGFASTIVTCHIFKTIMYHAHRTRPRDRPDDLMNGTFWLRHRKLDNDLSTLFMFLPEKLRLPDNVRDPSALHINLNLHAAVICLHHAAIEQAEAHGHGDAVKHASMCRLRTTAEEVANIIRMTSHNTGVFKSPLSALSMYCASTVYVYMAKENKETGLTPIDKMNLQVVVQAMEAIARSHEMTKAFLQQACLDIERNGLASEIRFPNLNQYRNIFGGASSNIPKLARVAVARHTQVSPVLPGRLPLGNPQGRMRPAHLRLPKSHPSRLTDYEPPEDEEGTLCFRAMLGAVTRSVNPNLDPHRVAVTNATKAGEALNQQKMGVDNHHNHKRRRVSGSPRPDGALNSDTAGFNVNSNANMATQGRVFSPSAMSGASSGNGPAQHQPPRPSMATVFPDRTNSSASSSPMNQFSTGTGEHTQSSHTSPGLSFGLGASLEENRVDLRGFQDRITTPIWQAAEQEVLGLGPLNNNNYGGDPWGILGADVDWDAQATTG